MINQLLHTPDGVRDIYGRECQEKITLENKLAKVLKGYGYQGIQTPSFEFFDVFGKEVGTTPSAALYKFFDSQGNTLVLRPDFTPSIARCVSTYFMEKSTPIRLCYIGNTFKNRLSYQGRLKEVTQAGAELIGNDSPEADAEILSLAADLIKSAGLDEFMLSVGHVGYLEGLFEAAALDKATIEEIQMLISNRNFYGVEDVIGRFDLDEDIKYLFGLLKDVMMNRKKLVAAMERSVKYPKVYNALDRLVKVEDLLRVYGFSEYVTYELAIYSDIKYYTGIIFAGYTFGSGEAIVNGGRYDDLLDEFGKKAPSIGFAIVVNQLMNALHRQNIEIPVENDMKWIIYVPERSEDAIKTAMQMRAAGESVELMPLDEVNTEAVYAEYAKENGISGITYFR